MNTIEWTCTYCSLFTKTVNKVKHLYIFLKEYEEDFEILYTCSRKIKNLTYPPIHKNKKCFKCKKTQEYCENIGYVWFCQCRHLEQAELLVDKIYIIINSHEKT